MITNFLQQYIKSDKERKRLQVVLTITIITLVILTILLLSGTVTPDTLPAPANDFPQRDGVQGQFNPIILSTRQLALHYWTQNAGTYAAWIFGVVASIFPLMELFKRKHLPIFRLALLKKALQTILKYLRGWHASIAVATMGLVAIHVYLALVDGIKVNITDATGLGALLIMSLLPFSGLLRYRRLDKRWHLIMGIAFVVLFLVHTTVSQPNYQG